MWRGIPAPSCSLILTLLICILSVLQATEASSCEDPFLLKASPEEGNLLLQKSQPTPAALKVVVNEHAAPQVASMPTTAPLHSQPNASKPKPVYSSLQVNGSDGLHVSLQMRIDKLVEDSLKLVSETNSSQCWKIDYEYGNEGKGSCANAELIALHCNKECLNRTRSQTWFSQELRTREVEHREAVTCNQACVHTIGCEFWVFDTRPGIFEKACWMKRAIYCDNTFGDSPGFISGPVTCDMKATPKEMVAVSEIEAHTHVMEVTEMTHDKSYHRQRSKSQWGPWLFHRLKLLLQLIGIVACLAVAVGIVFFKYTKAQQEDGTSEAKTSYRMQAASTVVTKSKQSDGFKGSAIPAPQGPEEASTTACHFGPPRLQPQASSVNHSHGLKSKHEAQPDAQSSSTACHFWPPPKKEVQAIDASHD